MIACRSLFKTERTWQLANTIVSSTRLECYSHHVLMKYRKQRFVENYSFSMDRNKKGKSVKLVWRPVCTVPGSNAECSADEPITGSTDLVNKDASSGRAAAEPNFRSNNLEDKFGISEVDGAFSEVVCSSSALPDNDETKAAEKARLSTARQSISIEVGASLMRFVKGRGGAMQKSIEEETGVKIIFPPSRNDDSIIIDGDSVESITKASGKIQTIISEAVQSPNFGFSHFISLPLAVHPGLVEKLLRFQNAVLGENNPEEDLGIDKSIFINPKTFHLTVLMLKLWNKERVHEAMKVLQSLSTKVMDVLDGRPLSIRLKGLDCMRGSPAEAYVLYAPVEEIGNEDRLVRACQVIIDAYVEAGLVLEKDAGHKLKLHATLMNARYRKSKTWNKRTVPFDARGIFEKYGSEEWGEYQIHEAHLSQRFAFDNSGYYHCCASLPLPSTTL